MTQRPLASALLLRFVLVFVSVIALLLTLRAISEYKAAQAQALSELNALADTFAPAAASAIWDYQNDVLQAIARGIANHPAVESVLITDSKHRLLADWHAAAVLAAAQPIEVSRELKRASGAGNGKILGGAFTLGAGFDLDEVGPSETRIRWNGNVTIFGRLTSLAGGVLQPIARKQIEELIGAIRAALDGGR